MHVSNLFCMMSNPLGNLCQNFTNMLLEDPDKYKTFVKSCAEELELAKAKPEPFACLEIDEMKSGETLYVNLLLWARVPKSSPRDPSALPLCGGMLGGINRADTANVAVNNVELARELLSGGPSGNILLDFLEHRNQDRKLEFDRSPFRLPWKVRQDVKFVGSLDKIVGSFEGGANDVESRKEEEKEVKLLTPTPKLLLKSLRDPAPQRDGSESKIVSTSNVEKSRAKSRPLISEYDPIREAKRSKFESSLRQGMEGSTKDKQHQGEIIKFCRPLTKEGAPVMSEVITRQITNHEMKPLIGRAVEKDGITNWIKIYFPQKSEYDAATTGSPLRAKNILLKLEQDFVRVQSSTGQVVSAVVNPLRIGHDRYQMLSASFSKSQQLLTIKIKLIK